jgi:hypothetical protein
MRAHFSPMPPLPLCGGVRRRACIPENAMIFPNASPITPITPITPKRVWRARRSSKNGQQAFSSH